LAPNGFKYGETVTPRYPMEAMVGSYRLVSNEVISFLIFLPFSNCSCWLWGHMYLIIASINTA
jgi:hypothetical protein